MGKVKKATGALEKEEKIAGEDISAKESIEKAMHNLNRNMSAQEQRTSIAFEEFLDELAADPNTVMRNIFQTFHDMMKAYVGEGIDEYPDDPESIHYAYYDCNKLFVEGSDHPFFADRFVLQPVGRTRGSPETGHPNKIRSISSKARPVAAKVRF